MRERLGEGLSVCVGSSGCMYITVVYHKKPVMRCVLLCV